MRVTGAGDETAATGAGADVATGATARTTVTFGIFGGCHSASRTCGTRGIWPATLLGEAAAESTGGWPTAVAGGVRAATHDQPGH